MIFDTLKAFILGRKHCSQYVFIIILVPYISLYFENFQIMGATIEINDLCLSKIPKLKNFKLKSQRHGQQRTKMQPLVKVPENYKKKPKFLEFFFWIG